MPFPTADDCRSGPVSAVEIDALVALRIHRHARDCNPASVTGALLGLQVRDTLEITSCFRHLLPKSAVATPAAATAVGAAVNAAATSTSTSTSTSTPRPMSTPPREHPQNIVVVVSRTREDTLRLIHDITAAHDADAADHSRLTLCEAHEAAQTPPCQPRPLPALRLVTKYYKANVTVKHVSVVAASCETVGGPDTSLVIFNDNVQDEAKDSSHFSSSIVLRTAVKLTRQLGDDCLADFVYFFCRDDKDKYAADADTYAETLGVGVEVVTMWPQGHSADPNDWPARDKCGVARVRELLEVTAWPHISRDNSEATLDEQPEAGGNDDDDYDDDDDYVSAKNATISLRQVKDSLMSLTREERAVVAENLFNTALQNLDLDSSSDDDNDDEEFGDYHEG